VIATGGSHQCSHLSLCVSTAMAKEGIRDELLDTLASRMFSAMLEDVLMDVTLQSHQEVARGRAVCEVCHTKCRQQHAPGPSAWSMGHGSSNAKSISRAATPSGEQKAAKDGAVYLPCVKCDREIASSRYASHLSTCMAVGSSRKAAQKPVARASSEISSPRPLENGGDTPEDMKPTVSAPPKKGRPPKNKPKAGEDTIKKRPASPQASPPKPKKQKTTSSPLSRVATEVSLNGNGLHAGSSQAKAPSRLRESSTATFFDRDSSKSRSPSPALATQHLQKQAASANMNSFGSGVGKGKKRMPSPPRPPAPVVRQPAAADYLIGAVEGDETGSSTDTDSD